MLRSLACPDTSSSGGPAPITSYARRVPSDAVANDMAASWRRTYARCPPVDAAPDGSTPAGPAWALDDPRAGRLRLRSRSAVALGAGRQRTTCADALPPRAARE